jgi:hypothetical protein
MKSGFSAFTGCTLAGRFRAAGGKLRTAARSFPGGHRVAECGDLRPSRKAVKIPGGKARVAPVGVLESRMAMWVGRVAISTQAFPSPPPE